MKLSTGVGSAEVGKHRALAIRGLTWIAVVSMISGAVWCLEDEMWWGAATLIMGGIVLAMVAVVWTGEAIRRNVGHGRHTPTMWPLGITVVAAVFSAFGVVAGAVWLVMAVGGISLDRDPSAMTTTDLLPAAIAVLSPVAALVAAVFVYRRTKIALAASRRADDEQYQKRFVDASVLLSNDNPAVRIAGVIAMATLARDWKEQRQGCVDVLCGYMRVPAELQEKTGSIGPKSLEFADHGENEVRNTLVVQLGSLLLERIVIDDETPVDLDLHNAVFGDNAVFGRATFTGTADFTGASFIGVASFRGATFKGPARILTARFARNADFEDATFNSEAEFFGVTFAGPAQFRAARFMASASFHAAMFTDSADFRDSDFDRTAMFMSTRFTRESYFRNTAFFDGAVFEGACLPLRNRVKPGGKPSRVPLGPLRYGSNLPQPPGSWCDHNGSQIEDAEWAVTSEECETDGS